MLKRLFAPGRTQAFDKKIPVGTNNDWVPIEGSNYGLPMEPGVYAVTVIPTSEVTLPLGLGLYTKSDNSYQWHNFQSGAAVRMRWDSPGELRFRATSEKGGYVTVLVTPVTNSLSLSLVEYAAAWLRRWHHGTKANQLPTNRSLHSHLRHKFMGRMEGRKHPLVHERQLQTDSRPRPIPCRIPQRLRAQHQRVGHPRQRHTSGAPGGSQNLRQKRGNWNLLHHQTRLAAVGGGC